MGYYFAFAGLDFDATVSATVSAKCERGSDPLISGAWEERWRDMGDEDTILFSENVEMRREMDDPSCSIRRRRIINNVN